ncbi:hypothetical protein H9P43_004935 [Blastocladiella emersonii ATCC 22665]|nr:hypothetical protein H9P43_004935 [Blastocladiella emersonii ATCC 22665]
MCDGLKDTAKAIVAFLVFICILGPALIIAGGYMLSIAGQPTREVAVAAFTGAGVNWDRFPASGDFGKLTVTARTANSTYTVGRTGSRGKEESKLASTEPTVPLPTSLYRYEGAVPSTANATLAWTSDRYNGTQPLGADLFPQLVTYTLGASSLDCRTGACTQSKQDDRDACNRKPLCSTACPGAGGQWNATTARCRFDLYPTSVCLLYDQNGGVSTTTGCYYETVPPVQGAAGVLRSYGIAEYGTQKPASVRVQLRHVDDPIVLASSLTEGSYYFGLSIEQKKTIGISLIIPGAIVTVSLFGGLAYFLVCRGRGGRQCTINCCARPPATVAPPPAPPAPPSPEPKPPVVIEQPAATVTMYPYPDPSPASLPAGEPVKDPSAGWFGGPRYSMSMPEAPAPVPYPPASAPNLPASAPYPPAPAPYPSAPYPPPPAMAMYLPPPAGAMMPAIPGAVVYPPLMQQAGGMYPGHALPALAGGVVAVPGPSSPPPVYSEQAVAGPSSSLATGGHTVVQVEPEKQSAEKKKGEDDENGFSLFD